MSWCDWFRRKAIMVDVESGQLERDKRELEEHIVSLKLDLANAMNLVQSEHRKHDEIRRRVSDARIEELRVQGTMRYTACKAELAAVRETNRQLNDALIAAYRRAEDEAIKRRVAFELSKDN